MPSCGTTTVQFGELPKPIEFEVVNTTNHPYPLIGVDACLNTGMIKIDETVNAIQISPKVTREWLTQNYDDVFRGLGLMPGEY